MPFIFYFTLFMFVCFENIYSTRLGAAQKKKKLHGKHMEELRAKQLHKYQLCSLDRCFQPPAVCQV